MLCFAAKSLSLIVWPASRPAIFTGKNVFAYSSTGTRETRTRAAYGERTCLDSDAPKIQARRSTATEHRPLTIRWRCMQHRGAKAKGKCTVTCRDTATKQKRPSTQPPQRDCTELTATRRPRAYAATPMAPTGGIERSHCHRTTAIARLRQAWLLVVYETRNRRKPARRESLGMMQTMQTQNARTNFKKNSFNLWQDSC